MRAKKPVSRTQGRPLSANEAVGREALIKSTRELLTKVPPERIKRLEVARYASVDPGLIRYYFGDVRQLLTVVTEDIMAEMRQRVTAATEQPGSVGDRLRARIRAYIAIYSENPHFHQLMIERIISGTGAEASRLRRDMLAGSIQQLKKLVNEGVRVGEMREVDPRFLHVAIVGMCSFFFSGHQVFLELFPEEKVRNRMIDAYTEFIADLTVKPDLVAPPVATNGRPARSHKPLQKRQNRRD